MEEIYQATNFVDFTEYYIPYFEDVYLILKFLLFGVALIFGSILILIAVRSWNQW